MSKLKFTIVAVGNTREEALACALQAVEHAVEHPEAVGQRIAKGLYLHAPTAWVDYSLKKTKPRKGKPIAVA